MNMIGLAWIEEGGRLSLPSACLESTCERQRHQDRTWADDNESNDPDYCTDQQFFNLVAHLYLLVFASVSGCCLMR
jgi:hypothetical protein